ncbi:hypothetical protein QE373_003283 [Stenotrophomonas sp. SORGH_AS321]|nr:hypothetical protein [Stenotrophomonas sp. SORGH_AS_0321]
MERQVSGTLINVAAHPHNGADTYLKLITAAHALNRAVRVHGDRYAWMSHLWTNKARNGKVSMTGNIATFTQIDMDGAWIDMQTRAAADAKRIDNVKRVVAGIQPNYHEFRFYFEPQIHLIAVETNDGVRSFSPRMAEKFFSELLSANGITDEFGDIEVNFVPDKESLNRIISSKFLRKISIHFSRPNADSLDDIERKVMESMNEMGARTSTVTYSAVRGATLSLTPDVKNLARVARRNGYVEGNVAGEPLSTRDHPIERRLVFDDNAQDQASAFDGLARGLIESESDSLGE